MTWTQADHGESILEMKKNVSGIWTVSPTVEPSVIGVDFASGPDQTVVSVLISPDARNDFDLDPDELFDLILNHR
jgi:hypothetical protein